MKNYDHELKIVLIFRVLMITGNVVLVISMNFFCSCLSSY